jgi:hypothetical protein
MRKLWPFKVCKKIGQMEIGGDTCYCTEIVRTFYGRDTWNVWIPCGITERMTCYSMTLTWQMTGGSTTLTWHVDRCMIEVMWQAERADDRCMAEMIWNNQWLTCGYI